METRTTIKENTTSLQNILAPNMSGIIHRHFTEELACFEDCRATQTTDIEVRLPMETYLQKTYREAPYLHLSGPLNWLNAILSLLQPLDRFRGPV